MSPVSVFKTPLFLVLDGFPAVAGSGYPRLLTIYVDDFVWRANNCQ
jgi:hypothetical protein